MIMIMRETWKINFITTEILVMELMKHFRTNCTKSSKIFQRLLITKINSHSRKVLLNSVKILKQIDMMILEIKLFIKMINRKISLLKID